MARRPAVRSEPQRCLFRFLDADTLVIQCPAGLAPY
jgi:hypothetical protein